jgi:hypothetical protein
VVLGIKGESFGLSGSRFEVELDVAQVESVFFHTLHELARDTTSSKIWSYPESLYFTEALFGTTDGSKTHATTEMALGASHEEESEWGR